jgi:hypothetical protein
VRPERLGLKIADVLAPVAGTISNATIGALPGLPYFASSIRASAASRAPGGRP